MGLQQLFEFGPFRLDVEARRVTKSGEVVALTPKVFETLRCLVESEGRILTKDEIMKSVWPDRFVEEANLTQNISVLRRALGEAESGTKYIATYPGKGYQFLVPVRSVSDGGPIAEPVTGKQRRPAARLIPIVGASALAIAAISYFALSRNTGTRPQENRPLLVTRLPGAEYQPAVSRDGTKVAFVWEQERTNGTAIMVKGPEDDSPRQVSGATFSQSSPAWSPDGKLLAFLRHEASAAKVIVVSDRGGPEKEIAELFPTRYGLNCRHLDWSPDGKTLAVDDKMSPEEPFGIFLVDVSSGTKRRLTKPDRDIIGDVDPRFSPDGGTLSFVRMTYRFNHDLFSLGLDGSSLTQLTHDSKPIGGHDWLPDGSAVVFSSNRDGGFRAWKLSRDGKPVATSVSGSSPIQLSTARLGSRLVYSEFQQDMNIWRLELGNKQWSKVIASTGEDILPQLSPDGKRVCFRSDRSGADQLWISNADGTAAVQLTRGALSPVVGRWSPDGSKIVFNSTVDQNIYVIDSAGGVARALSNPAAKRGAHPVFSHDGQAIFFSDTNDSAVMYTVPFPAGHPVSVLTGNGGFPKVPSTDGKHVYFVRGRTDSTISRLSLVDRKVEKLLGDLLPGYWGAWAVASRGIYYLSKSETEPVGAAVKFHDFAAGRSTEVADFPGPLPAIGTSTWSISPDGRFIYCVRVDQSNSDLVLVENFD